MEKSHLNGARPARISRDSIEQHLVSAGHALRTAGIPAPDVSRAWVRDLMRDRLIPGPQSAPKARGRGRRVRFAAAAYRDLLEVMKIRARGAQHRSTWLVWLWLRGRDFPLPRIREALAADVARDLKTVRDQLAPTGRYTEPFTRKFAKAASRASEESPFPSFGSYDGALAALMMRPQELPGMAVNLGDLASMLEHALDLDSTSSALEAVRDLQERAPADFSEAFDRLASLAKAEPARNMLRFLASASADGPPPFPSVAGLLDDGHGRSRLLDGLASSTDEELLEARQFAIGLRTGASEAALAARCSSVDADAREAFLVLRQWARMQRTLLLGNPARNAYFFANYLYALDPADAPRMRPVLDAGVLLRALRDTAASRPS